MEEQGGETRESKYRRLHYDGGSKMQEPPEGYRFMHYKKIQTDRGEKFVPITIGGFPILQPIPGYSRINKPRTSDLPLELMRYLYPDYDPSDPVGPVTIRCPDIPKPCVFLNEAHKKSVLDEQAAAIQRQADRQADLKRRQEKAFEDFRNYAANLAAASSGNH